MNQLMKEALKKEFEAPAPKEKQAFLKGVGPLYISNFQFVLVQASYIKKRVWGLSFLILGAALIAGLLLEQDLLWVLSALMPYLALSAVTENVRSEAYGMAELELASKFSLRSVVFARMEIIGMSHLLLLCFLVTFGHLASFISILQMGIYLLVPYLLTTVLGLWIVRKIHSKEAIYACMGTAIIISVLPMVCRYMIRTFYQMQTIGWWMLVLVILGFLTITEYKKSVDRTEELGWN